MSTPADAAQGPAEPTPEELAFLTGAKRYLSYRAQVRSTARWLIAALAAVGAVVFGAGPVLKSPALDWQTHYTQLLVAGAAGLLGLSAVLFLIWTIATVFLPQESSLGNLPTELIEELDADPARFPAGIGLTSVQQFRTALVEMRLAVASIAAQVGVKNAEAEISASAADKREAAAMAAGLEASKASLQVLEDFRAELIERGEFLRTKKRWEDLRNPLAIAAACAVVGFIVFPLALSAPAEKEDEADDAGSGAASPVVTSMIRVPGTAGDALWEALSLDGCERDGVVPVLLQGGKGTQAEPYAVQTIATETCRATSFTVVSAVAIVDVTEPPEMTITYSPAPAAGG